MTNFSKELEWSLRRYFNNQGSVGEHGIITLFQTLPVIGPFFISYLNKKAKEHNKILAKEFFIVRTLFSAIYWMISPWLGLIDSIISAFNLVIYYLRGSRDAAES